MAKDPRDANIYTADKGQPPSPDEGPTKMAKPRPDPRDANIFTADKGIQPPSPDEGPTRPVKKAKGGMIGSASKRADGCAVRGKTKGRIV